MKNLILLTLILASPAFAGTVMEIIDGTVATTTTPEAYSATYDPASLAASAARCDDVAVTGIVTGRAVTASPGVNPDQFCVIAAVWAQANDAVRVCWQNTGAVTACNTTTSTWTFTQ